MAHIITYADDAILESLYCFHFLTVKQIIRLHYKDGSAPFVSIKVKMLCNEGFIQRIALPSPIQKGSVPYVYFLDRKARSYLRGKGYDFRSRHYPSEQNILSYEAVQHALDVTEFLIAAIKLHDALPSIFLYRYVHDLTIRSMMQSPVVLDGFLDVRYGNQQQCIALELERTEKDKEAFQHKIAALLDFVILSPDRPSMYERTFNTDVVIFAYMTTIGTSYALRMKKLTEQVLKRM